MRVQYAFYSKMAERMAGATTYLMESGGPVRVTAVCDDRAWGESSEYNWSDKVYVGPVVQFIRRESEGLSPLEMLLELLS